jgi:hypothetical protein
VKPKVKVFSLPNSPLPLFGYEHPVPYMMALAGQTNGAISVITAGQVSGNNKCVGTF